LRRLEDGRDVHPVDHGEDMKYSMGSRRLGGSTGETGILPIAIEQHLFEGTDPSQSQGDRPLARDKFETYLRQF
jgi:hypothetical protein